MLGAMPRLSRRLTAALLWLAIALLPLRAWALSQMNLEAMGAAPSGVVSAGAAEVPAQRSLQPDAPPALHLPCHEAVVADGDGDSNPGSATCSLCDLCHAAVVQAPDAGLRLPELPRSRPQGPATTPIEPRAPDGLFRPPRTLLA
jgi:hypothetical protein